MNPTLRPNVHARRGGAKTALFIVAALAFGGGAVAAMALFANISKRKAEAGTTVLKIVDLTETTIDPAE